MNNIKALVQNVVAAVLGAISGGVAIMLVQRINVSLYPAPEGFNWADKQAVAEFFKTLPPAAFLVVLFGYLVGVTVGAWVAGKLSANAAHRQALLVTILFFAASVMNLLSLPHPIWFWVANLVIVPVAGSLALRLLGTPKPAAD
jgi:hypothetical protein